MFLNCTYYVLNNEIRYSISLYTVFISSQCSHETKSITTTMSILLCSCFFLYYFNLMYLCAFELNRLQVETSYRRVPEDPAYVFTCSAVSRRMVCPRGTLFAIDNDTVFLWVMKKKIIQNDKRKRNETRRGCMCICMRVCAVYRGSVM